MRQSEGECDVGEVEGNCRGTHEIKPATVVELKRRNHERDANHGGGLADRIGPLGEKNREHDPQRDEGRLDAPPPEACLAKTARYDEGGVDAANEAEDPSRHEDNTKHARGPHNNGITGRRAPFLADPVDAMVIRSFAMHYSSPNVSNGQFAMTLKEESLQTQKNPYSCLPRTTWVSVKKRIAHKQLLASNNGRNVL